MEGGDVGDEDARERMQRFQLQMAALQRGQAASGAGGEYPEYREPWEMSDASFRGVGEDEQGGGVCESWRPCWRGGYEGGQS